jgi:hypothetical protein
MLEILCEQRAANAPQVAAATPPSR